MVPVPDRTGWPRVGNRPRPPGPELSLAAWLGQRKWGRRLVTLFHPLSWGTSDVDWREIKASAEASRRLLPYYVYMAFVFRKPRKERSEGKA